MRKLLAPSLAAAAVLTAATAARALPHDTWVIAIGNDHGAAGEPLLSYAHRDASELADALRSLGGVSSDRVRILVDEDAETVRRTILEVNGDIRARAEAHQPTALILYFSGHGDADALHLGRSLLPIAELRELARGSAAGLRLVIVDACRSGSLTRVKGLVPAPDFDIGLDNQVATEGLAIISSSAAGETSEESDELRGSFFTHHLVAALRGAGDRDGNGEVTLGEAYAYAYTQTLHSSAQTLALQHPTYAYDVKGRNEVVLTTPGAKTQRIGRLRLGPIATYVIARGSPGGDVEAEVTPDRESALIALPEGRYFVEERHPAEFREYQVKLGEEEVSLPAQPARVVAYDQLVRKGGGNQRAIHGLVAMGGASSGVLPGEGAMPLAILGYAVDLPWMTLGLRLTGSTAPLTSPDGGLVSRHQQLSAGVLLERVIDLSWASVGVGVEADAVFHRQRFESVARPLVTRHALGPSFGALLSIEHPIAGGLCGRLETGPAAYLLPTATVTDGAQTASTRSSSLTFQAALGLVWRQ